MPDEHAATEMSVRDLRRNMAAALAAAADGRAVYITSRGRRVAVLGPTTLMPSLLSGSLADELERLHGLAERGALTAAEFERAKARLLDRP